MSGVVPGRTLTADSSASLGKDNKEFCPTSIVAVWARNYAIHKPNIVRSLAGVGT